MNCGYHDCIESEKCEWSIEWGHVNTKWRNFGPYGVCMLKGKLLFKKERVKKEKNEFSLKRGRALYFLTNIRSVLC